ncbi:hypothetical protein J2X66_000378 [Pseudomonas sp. 3296]|uniref:DUF6945 domain-containing protein n=1 Tax=Pseudomonas sp. 3296 TaxID=2817753 RepID=UPI002857EA7A|nr:hypothetical protein [Pseudomonas sp. 3296]MDR6913531.1 hypothetical protein [Pseudomonas sp. 3296]
MTEAFIKFPKALMAATHYISLTTGEEVRFTPSNKILWLHIKDRYYFFTSLGNEWFDNQEAIATATDSNVSTVKRFLAQLAEHGYLKTSKKKVGGCTFSNSYIVVQDLVLPAAGKRRATPASPTVQLHPKPTLAYSAADSDDDDTPVWEWKYQVA